MAVELPRLEDPGKWPRQARMFTHDLVGHPLFSFEKICDWVEAMPAESIQQHDGDLPVLHPTGEVRTIKEPTSTVLRELDRRNVWVQIRDLQHVSEFDELARSSTRAWWNASTSLEGGPVRRRVSMLLASPGAVVSAHFDRPHVLLYQISGSKEVFIGGTASRSGLDPGCEAEVAASISQGTQNLYGLPPTTTRFLLRPGTGLYIPPRTPHWVLGGTDASVALTCNWDTRWSDSEYWMYYWNARLRRFKIPVGPVVPGKRTNRLKAMLVYRLGRIVEPLQRGGRSALRFKNE